MRRKKTAVPVIGIVAVLLMALSAASALAAISGPSFDPTAAPTGTHVQRGTPSCSVNGLRVSCSSYQLAGVGNTNATANLSVTYSATVVCINNGGNSSDSQHQGTFPT